MDSSRTKSEEIKMYQSFCPSLQNHCSTINLPKTLFFPSAVPENVNPVKIRMQFSKEFLKSVWPNSDPPTKLSVMNCEETAVWVQMLSKFKGWPEWKTYCRNFENNEIWGWMLKNLSVQNLQKLNIWKLGHRLEIIEAIKDNEFTLMNPFIVPPSISFVWVTETSQCSSGQVIRSKKHKHEVFGEEFSMQRSSVLKNPTLTRHSERSRLSRDTFDTVQNRELTRFGDHDNGFGSFVDTNTSMKRDHISKSDTKAVNSYKQKEFSPMPEYYFITGRKVCSSKFGQAKEKNAEVMHSKVEL